MKKIRASVPRAAFSFESQARQYPATGKPGLGYFRGEMGGGKHIDALLHRNSGGRVVGILNHYPHDFPPYEKKGNVNVMVHPEHRRKGIGSGLLREGIKRWKIDVHRQQWTPEGAAMVNALLGKAKMRKGEAQQRLRWQGVPIRVETRTGGVRNWIDAHAGRIGHTRMKVRYGYIPGVKGMDQEWLDVFIGPRLDAELVYVIDQMKPPDFLELDEQDVMLGYGSAEEARQSFLDHYDDERFYGGMLTLSVEAFLDLINPGKRAPVPFRYPLPLSPLAPGGKYSARGHLGNHGRPLGPVGLGLPVPIGKSLLKAAAGSRYDESKHPRAKEHSLDPKYKGGQFVPKGHPTFSEKDEKHPKEHIKTAGEKDVYFEPAVTNKTVRQAMEMKGVRRAKGKPGYHLPLNLETFKQIREKFPSLPVSREVLAKLHAMSEPKPEKVKAPTKAEKAKAGKPKKGGEFPWKIGDKIAYAGKKGAAGKIGTIIAIRPDMKALRVEWSDQGVQLVAVGSVAKATKEQEAQIGEVTQTVGWSGLSEKRAREQKLVEQRGEGWKVYKPRAEGAPVESEKEQLVAVKLYPFQKAGVKFLSKLDKAMLCDDMGLGKTFQSIAWAAGKGGQTLVVVPGYLRQNWLRELRLARPYDKVALVSGGKDFPPPGSSDWVVVGYETANKHIKRAKGWNFKNMLIDEAHKIKSIDATRTNAVMQIALQNDDGPEIPNRMSITGSPLLNRTIEMYPQLAFLGKLPWSRDAWLKFGHDYTNAAWGRFGWNFSGSKNVEALRDLIKPFYLRREKEEVLTELPAKSYDELEIDISNRPEYDAARRDIVDFIRKEKGNPAGERAARAKALVQLNYLRKIAAKGKAEAVIERMRDFLDAGKKLVVFSTFSDPLTLIHEAFPEQSVLLTGETPAAKRDELVQQFQKDPKVSFIVANIDAAGTGYTMTAADQMYIINDPWSPMIKEQAEDRIHRIGQANAVNITTVIGKGTIDRRIAEILKRKSEEIKAVTESGVSAKEIESSMADEVMDYLLDEDDRMRRAAKRKAKKAGGGDVKKAESGDDDKLDFGLGALHYGSGWRTIARGPMRPDADLNVAEYDPDSQAEWFVIQRSR